MRRGNVGPLNGASGATKNALVDYAAGWEGLEGG